MELLVMLVALIALGLLAQRYGYDSRDRLRSAEERLAAAGFRSADGTAPTQPEPGRRTRAVGAVGRAGRLDGVTLRGRTRLVSERNPDDVEQHMPREVTRAG